MLIKFKDLADYCQKADGCDKCKYTDKCAKFKQYLQDYICPATVYLNGCEGLYRLDNLI